MKTKPPQVKMIEQGYTEGPMMFRVYFVRQELQVVKECMDVVGEYNEFRASKVFSALRKLDEAGLLYSVEFGREYSPVLYLSLQGGRMINTSFLSGGEWRDFTPENHRENVAVVKKVFEGTKYSEWSVTTNEGVPQIRVWWD